ncbi:hypothetical protein E2K72_16850, partial [Escherichia coli]|uniref:hypothetical protein n=1 Tax=Escherichia coli TaxID=562 RepID=UPI0011F3A5EC
HTHHPTPRPHPNLNPLSPPHALPSGNAKPAEKPSRRLGDAKPAGEQQRRRRPRKPAAAQ